MLTERRAHARSIVGIVGGTEAVTVNGVTSSKVWQNDGQERAEVAWPGNQKIATL